MSVEESEEESCHLTEHKDEILEGTQVCSLRVLNDHHQGLTAGLMYDLL